MWRPRDGIVHAIFALLGVCGILLVLLGTSRYGVGTCADVEHYLSTARNLLAGKGYRCFSGEPYTQWPPLFPTLLAALGLTGIEPQVGARWLNAVAFGLTVFLSGQLFLRCTRCRTSAVVGALAVLTAKPLMDGAVMALSEPVFVVLTILFALGMGRFLRRRSPANLLCVSILGALASLDRYVGVSLIPAGALLIGLGTPGTGLARRLKRVAIFGAIAVTPVALWCIRNRLVARRPVGGHRFHLMTGADFGEAWQAAVRVVGTCPFPWLRDSEVRPLHLGLVLAVAGALIVLSRVAAAGKSGAEDALARDSGAKEAGGPYLWSASVIGLVYSLFVIACSSGLYWRPSQRHLAPAYAFIMAVLVAGIAGAVRLLSARRRHGRLVIAAEIVLCGLWLACPCTTLYRDTGRRMQDGAGGFSTSTWQNSPLIDWLRRHPPSDRVYTNGTDAMYLLTGTVTYRSPRSDSEKGLADLARFAAGQPCCIVWFRAFGDQWVLYDLREILSRCHVQEAVTFPDGGVYRCFGPGGPGVAAVYRFWSPRWGGHFYTADLRRRDELMKDTARGVRYERTAFHAFSQSQPETRPVYRLRSGRSGVYFYTMSETEKEDFLRRPSEAWACEDIAFYAYPEKSAEDLMPVHRLRYRKTGGYFYTLLAHERDKLLVNPSTGWSDEGIAWYAYGP
jgi:hypothetical protein